MRIAVDFQSAQGNKTGIGVYAENLVEALGQEDPSIELNCLTTARARDLSAAARILWESVEIPLRLGSRGADLLFSPGFAPAFFSTIPQVVTVHDLIGVLYPRNLPPAARFYWSWWLPHCVKRAKVVVASSESTRRDIIRLLKRPADSIHVVPLAPNRAFSKENTLGARVSERPFFLHVGTLEPRKNIPNLLRAFSLFKKETPSDVMLILAGKAGGAENDIRRLIRELDLEKEVRLLGYVADPDLNQLYNQAVGYVFLSIYEGFGLPVLEAMRCGLSGIVSDSSSLPEVAGHTALYADPLNPESIAGQMSLFYSNAGLRRELADAAWRRSQAFTWQKTARMMIEIFRQSL
ncbi:MAG: glycosyltransferase family 4 protein [Candidatus Omnitrophica bacterium]|nr:glycosyltransferase family 4 protein [Candidatus Omnitrophota bacterium]